MANRTDPTAATVHGTNPQNLVEKIVRSKIYDCQYWKEHCFGLTAESLIDKAVGLRSAGGTFGGARKPCEFLCLILKLLQLQPDKEIIIEYIKNEEFKYVRILGAFYLRLVGKPLEVYQYLEPLFNDYRKVRLRNLDGSFAGTHVDECVDQMLHSDLLFDIALPRIPHRLTLERIGQLEARISVLEDDFDEAALEAEAGAAQTAAEEATAMDVDKRPSRSRSRSRSRERKEERAREKWRDRPSTKRVRERDLDLADDERERERRRHRSRSGSRERRRHSSRERDERSHRSDRGDRDRDRERRRRRSRSGSRERHRKEPRREGRRERDEELPPPPPGGGGGGGSKGEVDIAETNAMRAKLGLKPLK